jgi:hypothetical protein
VQPCHARGTRPPPSSFSLYTADASRSERGALISRWYTSTCCHSGLRQEIARTIDKRRILHQVLRVAEQQRSSNGSKAGGAQWAGRWASSACSATYNFPLLEQAGEQVSERAAS